jgi:hypothetical protein
MGLNQSKNENCNPETATSFDIEISKVKMGEKNSINEEKIKNFKEKCPKQAKKSENAILNKNNTSGGSKKQTKEYIIYQGKKKLVYNGPKGGKYIKKNNKFISIK